MSSSPLNLINGQPSNAISVMDRGFAYGDGVFRTIKVLNGVPLNWDRHFAKLLDDCGRLKLDCPDANVWQQDIAHLFADAGDGVAKLMLTRGIAERGYAIGMSPVTRVSLRSALPIYPASHAEQGIQVHLCQTRLAHQPLLAGIKHLNRLENVLARMEWQDTDISEGVMLDQQGLVIEGVMSNILLRSGKILSTPDLQQCGVAGVTRQQILSLAPSLGLQARVANIALDELMQADEMLMCNSLYGVWQVVNFNGRRWVSQDLATELRQLLQG